MPSIRHLPKKATKRTGRRRQPLPRRARAEQIHFSNHARVIGLLGGHAECHIHEIEIKGTLDNLKVALAGENYEVNEMYPEFLAEAEPNRQGRHPHLPLCSGG